MSASTIISINVVEVDLALPAQFLLSLAGVTHQQVHLGRPNEGAGSIDDVVLVVQPGTLKATSQSSRTEWVSPVAMTKSSGVIALQHQPHRAHVVLGVAPVPLRVEVAEAQILSSRP
jgi:hypothetical protein